MMLNWSLATRLAFQNLKGHRVVSAATVLGVAIGMAVVTAILIVDHNTALTPEEQSSLFKPDETQSVDDVVPDADIQPLVISSIGFVRQGDLSGQTTFIPNQERPMAEIEPAEGTVQVRGEEDYQAMRLAVRLASLFAFCIGTVIVFYTMRFSVASRNRALSLFLCLGEFRSNLVLSLLIESLFLGLTGSLIGLLLGVPISRALLLNGISTTGRIPLHGFTLPWTELAVITIISVAVALLGIVGPARSLYRMRISSVLQPRFLSEEFGKGKPGLVMVIPALVAAGYLMVRPFLQSWFSVVEFFLFEAIFVVALCMVTLWWVQPLLRLILRVCDVLLRPFFPLETLLAGRRMRLMSQKVASSVIGITLVFALLTGLHDITRALKSEIVDWVEDALVPYVFFQGVHWKSNEAMEFLNDKRQQGAMIYRLSVKTSGEFPMRLVAAGDVNSYREARGLRPIQRGTVILSRALAGRFRLSPGDVVEIGSRGEIHRFRVIAVEDHMGYFPIGEAYVDAKSYALLSDGNPLFADNIERTLGQYAVAHREDRGLWKDLGSTLYYRFLHYGYQLGDLRVDEIDRDFLIFDFVMLMTIVLAGVGVTNSLLIQVHARDREFSVLTTVGISRLQIAKLLLIEGALIGMLSALLALILGHILGMISVTFLDRFTLFEYRFVFSAAASVWVFVLAVVTCCVAAAYPALLAARPPTGESLHYE